MRTRNLKTIVYKLVLMAVLVLMATALYSALFPMSIFNKEYPIWRKQQECIRDLSTSPKIIILGDSRPMAGIDPKLLSDDSYSLCVPGATPIETYYSLRTYLETHKAPKIVVLSYTPCHFEVHRFFWERTVKFKFLALSEAREVICKSLEYKDPFLHLDAGFKFDSTKPPTSFDYIRLALYYLNYFNYYKTDISRSVERQPWKTNYLAYREIGASKGHTFFGTLNRSDGLMPEAETPHQFTPSKLVDYYFKRLIELCHQNNIRIVYKTMPFNENTYKTINPEYFTAYLNYLVKSPLRFPDIVDRTVERYPDTCFGDHSHLNYSGTEKYSRELKAFLDTLQ